MKIRKSIYTQVLRIVFFIGLLFFNNAIMYAQDDMQDAKVSLSFSEDTDTKTITATVTDQNGLAAEEVELSFFVKRTFSLLKIGDGFNETDEDGVVEVAFPSDLPGDAEGNVTIIVKILDNDLYNDLSVETIKKWGVPTIINDDKDERSLWAAAANAPITLIISVTGMIFVIWFIILYIIFSFYKISKIKPLNL
ncbi:MAG: hypothetical protein HQ471_07975 [Flavobacteriales bacterium]|nr:hypothetical protein [Flavobacteriales bacterium]